jgi:hypothetical protein
MARVVVPVSHAWGTATLVVVVVVVVADIGPGCY